MKTITRKMLVINVKFSYFFSFNIKVFARYANKCAHSFHCDLI